MQRMALFPNKAEVLFINEDSWVPVVRLAGKLCVFPGIPSLFQRMLTELTPYLPLPPKSERPLRIQIFTDRLESMIAPYLTSLQKRVSPSGIQVGSYPVMGKGVFVSLIGRDPIQLESTEGAKTGMIWLADIAREVEREVGGRVASDEEVVSVKQEAVIKQQEEAFKSPVNTPGIQPPATPKF
jgi:molybdopterin-biosynthesis enzyme MoeA-like protein